MAQIDKIWMKQYVFWLKWQKILNILKVLMVQIVLNCYLKKDCRHPKKILAIINLG